MSEMICPQCLKSTNKFSPACESCGAIIVKGTKPDVAVDSAAQAKGFEPVIRDINTKKCPFCAERIQLEAVVCRWCQRSLSPQKPAVGGRSIFRIVSVLLFSAAAFSFFIPFATFQISAFGTQTLSGVEVVIQAVKSMSSDSSAEAGNTGNSEVNTLNQIVNNQNEDILAQKPIYKLIPYGMFCGVLAYMSLILIAMGLIADEPPLVLIASLISFGATLAFLSAFLLLNDLLHYSINTSMEELKDNPFAGLATLFTQGIKIQPAIAIYLLGTATFFLALVNYVQNKYCPTKARKKAEPATVTRQPWKVVVLLILVLTIGFFLRGFFIKNNSSDISVSSEPTNTASNSVDSLVNQAPDVSDEPNFISVNGQVVPNPKKNNPH